MRFDCELSCRDIVAGEGNWEMKLSIVFSHENLKTSTETRSSNARRKTKRSLAWYEDFVSFLRRGEFREIESTWNTNTGKVLAGKEHRKEIGWKSHVVRVRINDNSESHWEI